VSSYQFAFTLHIYLAIQLHWQSNFTDFFSCDIFDNVNFGRSLKLQSCNGAGCKPLEIMNEMTYYDSAEGTTITKVRALFELQNHGITDPDEFFDDMGDRESYNAQEVLSWLGY